MKQLGFGVMINALTHREPANVEEHYGKTIKEVILDNDSILHLRFDDGTALNIWDDGHSCCESRYMRTDDDLGYYSGAQLLEIKLEAGPDITGDIDEHEQLFLHVKTSKGSFTMSNHNEHNGYYGGFSMLASVESE